MTATLDVIEDGVEDLVQPRPSRLRWLPITLSFIAGLGLGIITLGSEQQAVQGERTDELAAATDRDGPAIGIAVAVPGFPDSVVAIAATENSALDRVLWQARSAPTTRAMADGDNVVLDSGAEFIALSSTVPGLDGSLLSMGRFNLIRAVSAGVTSYAWHDSENGQLTYTIESAGHTTLFTVNFRGLKDEIPWVDEVGAHIAAWGSWGWAVQSTPDRITLLAPDGEFKDVEPGRVLASNHEGWILAMEGAEPKLVSAGGGVKRFATGADFGIVASAHFSPDGSSVAIAGSKGIAVLDRSSGEADSISDNSTTWVSWSSDSRFLLSSATTGFVVHDLKTGAAKTVLNNYAILTAKAVPGSS